MREVTLQAKGVTPIMLHGMGVKAVLVLGKFIKSDEKAPATPDEACRRAVYVDEEGFIVLPTDNLASASVAAGQKVKIGSPQRQISTADTTDLFSYFNLLGDYIRILDADGKPIPFPQEGEPSPWVVDVRRGVGYNSKTPTAICVVRPKFALWGFETTLTYNERELPRGKFVELLQQAARKGLGSFRPSKGRGRYGVWKPIRVDEVTIPDEADDLIITLDGKEVDLKAEPILATPKKGRKTKEVAA